MKVVLISAKAQHGKDTFANIMAQELKRSDKRVLITHYADLVKYVATTFFDWNGIKDRAGRELLQKVGTDQVRSYFPNFWVDFIKNILTVFNNEWDYVLIPDARFPNELEIFKDNTNWSCNVVRIVRDNFISPLTKEQKNHPSETALDNYCFDYVINNNGTLLDLKQEARKLISYIERGIN